MKGEIYGGFNDEKMVSYYINFSFYYILLKS